jgi:hypothetical protein
MNISITKKIRSHLQHLAMKAAEKTLDERGFWGLGEISSLPDLQSFSLKVEQKYQLQIASAHKKIDKSFEDITSDELKKAEPHYGTDWVVVCSMHGTLRDLFISYGLDPRFEFEIEHEENHCFVLTNKSELKIHYAYHDFISSNKLTGMQIDTLCDEVTKLTLFSYLSL